MTEQVNMALNAPRPNAFKARMAAARAETGQPQLAHQSLGRALSEAEANFAAALMEIYGEGEADQTGIAAALTARGIAKPSNGETAWTAENLAAELEALNADLDAAYADNGFGA